MPELSIPVRVKRHQQEDTAKRIAEKLQVLNIRTFSIQYGIDSMTVNVFEDVPHEKAVEVHTQIALCNPLRLEN